MIARHPKLVVALALLLARSISAQVPSGPASAGVSTDRLARIDSVVAESIKNKELPGAVVVAGHRGRVVWRKSYGSRAVEPQREAMTTDTMFDLASLTKVVATATSIMILVERGEVRLNDPAVKFIPEMKGAGRDAITIAQLLTHVSGLPLISIFANAGQGTTKR